MSLTRNGISTTTERGQFAYEEYFGRVFDQPLIQWDYRDMNGKLHSGIASSLEQAKSAAAKWGYKEDAL